MVLTLKQPHTPLHNTLARALGQVFQVHDDSLLACVELAGDGGATEETASDDHEHAAEVDGEPERTEDVPQNT